MEIRPTPEQEALIREAIADGRITNAEDAAREGLALWAQRERARALGDYRQTLDQAEMSIVEGDGIAITREAMHELAEDVKRRARERLADKN